MTAQSTSPNLHGIVDATQPLLIAGPNGRRVTGAAILMAIGLHLALLAILVTLNNRSQERPRLPPRVTWITVSPPPTSPPLADRREVRRPETRRRASVEPKMQPLLPQTQLIEPRVASPRAVPGPSMPRPDVHPELGGVAVPLVIHVPPSTGVPMGSSLPLETGKWLAEPPRYAEPAAAIEPKVLIQEKSQPNPQDVPSDPAVSIPLREPDHAPMPVYSPPPQYPVAALHQGIEGYAIIQIQINTDGRVIAVKPVEHRGHPSFVSAAEDVVRRWRFNPARRDGKAVTVWCLQKITFAIER